MTVFILEFGGTGYCLLISIITDKQYFRPLFRIIEILIYNLSAGRLSSANVLASANIDAENIRDDGELGANDSKKICLKNERKRESIQAWGIFEKTHLFEILQAFSLPE